jgi:hypothetical protein
MKGYKLDKGKAPLSLCPLPGLEAEARALAFGLKKYPKNNFKLGMRYSRISDATLRHVLAWCYGEDLDQESGLSHLAHAKACLAMLITIIERGTGEDDR